MGTSKGYGLPKTGNWPLVKRRVTFWGKSEESTTDQIEKVMDGYARAHGSAKEAVQQSSQANMAGAKLGGFLSGVRSEGLGSTLENNGLGYLAGRPASEVIQGIEKHLLGEGSSLDDELVRGAFEGFQEEFIGHCETYEELDKALTGIAAIDIINDTLERLFGHIVYTKFKRDFSERLLEIAGGVKQANNRLKQIKDYIFLMISAKLHGSDPSQVDWQGEEGQQMAEEIHTSVWQVFGEA